MLITDPLVSHASQYPEKVAIAVGERHATYSELYERVNRISEILHAMKRDSTVGEEYKIAFMLRNPVEFLEFFLGAAMAGWVALPFDPKWSSKELQTTLHNCRPEMFVGDEAFVHQIQNHSAEKGITVKDVESFLQLHGETDIPSADKHISDQSPFYMGFTSGTTGKPKGFLRSHRSWVKSFEGSQAEFGIDSRDCVLVPGPLVHSHFLYAAIHALFISASVIVLDKFSPGKVIESLAKLPVTVLYMVPTMFEAVAAAIEEQGSTLEGNRIRSIISSGAKWSPASKRKVSEWFPQGNLYEFYGSSELSFVTVLDPEGNRSKPDSIGRPFHQVKVSIRDEEGKEVEDGVIGKLYVQSELIFSGYYKNERETNEVLCDGWATVHDLAWRDGDGYIYITGREKNMIIYGGLNVYPEEVERVIKQLPHIEEAVVLGKPDEYWGEKVVAAIRTKHGMALKPREIQAHCRKHLASYKCPREMFEMETIPYTTSGKVARKALIDLLFLHKE